MAVYNDFDFSSNTLQIQTGAVLEGFEDVVDGDVCRVAQIRNSARKAQDAVVRAG